MTLPTKKNVKLLVEVLEKSFNISNKFAVRILVELFNENSLDSVLNKCPIEAVELTPTEKEEIDRIVWHRIVEIMNLADSYYSGEYMMRSISPYNDIPKVSRFDVDHDIHIFDVCLRNCNKKGYDFPSKIQDYFLDKEEQFFLEEFTRDGSIDESFINELDSIIIKTQDVVERIREYGEHGYDTVCQMLKSHHNVKEEFFKKADTNDGTVIAELACKEMDDLISYCKGSANWLRFLKKHKISDYRTARRFIITEHFDPACYAHSLEGFLNCKINPQSICTEASLESPSFDFSDNQGVGYSVFITGCTIIPGDSPDFKTLETIIRIIDNNWYKKLNPQPKTNPVVLFRTGLGKLIDKQRFYVIGIHKNPETDEWHWLFLCDKSPREQLELYPYSNVDGLENTLEIHKIPDELADQAINLISRSAMYHCKSISAPSEVPWTEVGVMPAPNDKPWIEKHIFPSPRLLGGRFDIQGWMEYIG